MIIETKHKLGDIVYFMAMNRIQKDDVTGIYIDIKNESCKIRYNLRNNSCMDENDVFNTREELLKSL
jgi:hypothetical protein